MNVINLSPDVLPVYLYINYIKRNTSPYKYSIPSGYISIATLDTPLQIRNNSFVNVLSLNGTTLAANTKYTWIITGLNKTGGLTSIFTVDTAVNPKTGYGKVRFVHASPNTLPLDLFANGTAAVQNQAFTKVSSFFELPAGNYDFKIYQTGTTSLLADLKTTTIQDGRLYTIYTQGIAGHTDTAAFTAAVITNR